MELAQIKRGEEGRLDGVGVEAQAAATADDSGDVSYSKL